MFDWLNWLFDTSDFPARWNCGPGWSEEPWLGWLHIISDTAIWGAYVAIPAVILYFVFGRRRDLPFLKVFWLFGAFIFACGTTHLLDAVIFWHPVYRLAGWVKFYTAVVSWGTVVALVQVIPQALRLPGISKLNDQLTREVQERKEAQTLLHENRLLLQNVLDNTPTIMYLKDRQGRLLVANRPFAELVKKNLDEIVGRLQQEVLAGADLSQVIENDRLVFESGQRRQFEEVLTLPHGERAFLSVKAPIPGLTPGETVLCGVSTDITERKHEQERIRENEQRLRLALESGRMGTWDWDIRQNKIFWSTELEAIHGLLPGTFAGTREAFMAQVHPEDRARMNECVERTLRDRVDLLIEYRSPLPNGQIRWFERRGKIMLDAAGQPVRMSGICVDITDRKIAEDERERLLASERWARGEAERASRAKDEFLSLISHELRNPLNAILGYAQLLRYGNATPDVEQAAEVIERNGWTQAQIIDDLLDMSRIISGKMRLDVQNVALADAINAAMETVQPAAQAKEIRLLTVLDPRAGSVLGDSGRLQQVIWNLLSNAIKFTPRGGRVQISLQRVNSHVEITVSDTGQGIRPEFLPYVFDRFRQQDATTTREKGGLGLGLSIVKSLVELHGGSVAVYSEGEGRGSTFVVALPVQMAPAQDGAADRRHPAAENGARPTLEAPAVAGLHVLVVDDEPDARAIVRRFLEEAGVRVTTADSAEQALQLVKELRPDALLSDIGMPGIDGYQFIRQLRIAEDALGSKTPAAAVTAFARREDRTRTLLSGYQAHITKPINPHELLAVIAAITGRVGAQA